MKLLPGIPGLERCCCGRDVGGEVSVILSEGQVEKQCLVNVVLGNIVGAPFP
jgi:hypothetical protein